MRLRNMIKGRDLSVRDFRPGRDLLILQRWSLLCIMGILKHT